MADEVFQPADQVPESGVYQVLHYRHRLYHDVTLLHGGSFPSCSECGNNVRFRLVRSAPLLNEDRNFSVALGHRRGNRSPEGPVSRAPKASDSRTLIFSSQATLLHLTPQESTGLGRERGQL